MYYFFGCMIIPVIILVLAKFLLRKTISWKEFGISSLASVVVVASIITLWYAKTLDHEILNGYVVGKQSEEVSCDHSYQCNCRSVQSCTGSGDTRSCSTSTECDTCYEHSYDVDWNVETTVGSLTIERIDDQGVETPPRWEQVQIGEFAANDHMYKNYVRATRDSLFTYDKSNYELFKDTIPDYPEIYDYYRFNRVINMASVDVTGWNDTINKYLRTAGAEKQVNVIVITTTNPEVWSESVLYDWYGGKKNDVILIYGFTDKDKTKVSWFRATSFANGMNNQSMIVQLRNESIGSVFDMSLLEKSLSIINKEFHRLSMEEMKYLRDSTQPPSWLLIMAVILGIVTSVGTSYVFHRHDI